MARADRAVAEDMVFLPFAYVEAAANILTNPQLDPYGKIPEFKSRDRDRGCGIGPSDRLRSTVIPEDREACPGSSGAWFTRPSQPPAS
jgi:predicted molibdopterin-dependent oxidoreductase YjgC